MVLTDADRLNAALAMLRNAIRTPGANLDAALTAYVSACLRVGRGAR